IVLGAGLRSIPGEMYEAARIDGATNWRQLISITVPLLSPSIFFLTVLSVIHGMELFYLIFIMFGESNPIRVETQSMVSLLYREAFISNDKCTGAAIAILLMLIIGVLTAVQFAVQRRRADGCDDSPGDRDGAARAEAAHTGRDEGNQCQDPCGTLRRRRRHRIT